MKKFDLIIIGGGAGAFAAAIRANELKAKTAMINTGLPLGGTCVNVGCVPSKTLLWAGETLYHAKHHGIPGIDIEVKNFDFKKVVQDELGLVERLRKEKYEKVLASLEHITLIEGRAVFVAEDAVEVNPSMALRAGGQRYSAAKFVIATGSTANVPPIEGIRKVGYLTHIEALRLEKQPERLAVVGAGPLGLEFAQMFARFGTKVSILEHSSSIFPHSEPALTARLVDVLRNEGIHIHTGVEVKQARIEDGKRVLTYVSGEGTHEVAVDKILLAAGKTPNTDGLELDKIGVDVSEHKAMVVNEFFQTSNPNVFAVGDATNLPLRFETTAGREGTLVAENALSGTKLSIDYSVVPYTIFTDPQLAGVGFTEDAQMKEMGVCACRTVSFEDIPKAIIMRRTEGFIKMAIAPKDDPSTGLRAGQILGVHILSPNASEIIAEAMMLVKNKNTIDDVVNSLPMFPTLSEAIKLVALSFTKDISKLSCCV